MGHPTSFLYCQYGLELCLIKCVTFDSVNESVAPSEDISMTDYAAVGTDEDAASEIKPAEDLAKLKEQLRHQLEYYFSK